MILRTPRRRISPRTKLKYRAIREFFRRTLGSTSQQDIRINSSIAINVSDLKTKIVGLEQQLDEVNKHCRDFACFDNCSRRESESDYQYDHSHDMDTIKEQTETSSERKSNALDTRLIYKSADCNYKSSDHITKSLQDNVNEKQMMNDYECRVEKGKSKKSNYQYLPDTGSKLHKHKTRSAYSNVLSAHSTNSFHSLATSRIRYDDDDHRKYCYDRKHFKENEAIIKKNYRDRKYKEFVKRNIGDHSKALHEEKLARIYESKRSPREVDPDYITEIIRRQYKPVKTFGRKQSDFSQFSAPICRDQEFSINENIQEGSELCSCFYDGTNRRHKRSKHKRQEVNGMRSVCDTRIYSSNKHARHKHHRMHVDAYSNSDMYDLVPVKEKCSPKARRKFVKDNIIPYEHYREVPPSPRTCRPRLNLNAQYYTESEDNGAYAKPVPKKKYQQYFETDSTSDFVPDCNVTRLQSPQKLMKVLEEGKEMQEQGQQHDTGTMSSLQYPQYANDHTNIGTGTLLNKTQTEINVVNTDKALCEIKDILQSFLQEIKKDTVASQTDKSDHTGKTQENVNILQDNSPKLDTNILPNSASFNSYNIGQCGPQSYMAPFANSCCYQIMPVCPINCSVPVPNGYLIPNSSQSFTCSNCVNVPKECNSAYCCNRNAETTGPNETDELIKEIYKFVAQSPIRKQGRSDDNSKADSKLLTSRSVGGSNKNFHNDAKVGTPQLKCYSKSCEAIGSRIMSEACYSGTNASYSDTLLEKLSLEATTHSVSETELETATMDPDKKKNSKFSKVLRSFGLLKKKKADAIEELNESESVINEEVKPKQPLFRQQLTNYMMHGQEYYHPPPVEPLCHREPDTHRQPHDYQPRPMDYELKSHNCQHRSQEHKTQSSVYPLGPHTERCGPHGYQPRPHEYQPEYHPPFNPNAHVYRTPWSEPYGHMEHPHQQRIRHHPNARSPITRPTAPPYSSSYETSYSQIQPPFCLKEIEVKSTGTQSERKMSIFRKIRQKMQPPIVAIPMAAGDQRNFSTQTAPNYSPITRQANMTKPLFSWKGLQAKAMKGLQDQNMDPMTFSLKTQKELAAGDLKLRNAMLKKMFYKRNPFSPRNLIVRTLLGKDKSSYGDPPKLFRPKMFF